MKDIVKQLNEALSQRERVALSAEEVLSVGKISPESNKLDKYIDNVLSGKDNGYGVYYDRLESMVGKIYPGQLWVIGGFSGTGKSYFALNLVEGILGTETPPKVGVFSTELTHDEYVKRLLFLRAGIYELSFLKDPKKHLETVQDNLVAFKNDSRFDGDLLMIWGDISSIEDIEDRLKALKEVEKVPEVIVVDWVQQLSADDTYSEKDAMPLIAKRLKKATMDYKCAIIVVSQVNNYANAKDYKIDSSQTAPFSFGKELNQVADVAIMLHRIRHKGKQSKHLSAKITKSRHGSTGVVSFRIESGFKMVEISTEDGVAIDMELTGGELT